MQNYINVIFSIVKKEHVSSANLPWINNFKKEIMKVKHFIISKCPASISAFATQVYVIMFFENS